MTSESTAIDGAIANRAPDRPYPGVNSEEPVARKRPMVRARLWSLAIRGAALLVTAGLIAAGSYQAGRSDLLGSLTGPDAVPRIVQIGSDTPGQPFGLLVD